MMTTKPNVVFILADDLGYWSLGCEGNPEAKTPNIDAIAADGVRMSGFFCASPVCSPARASLLTGRMPSDHGVLDWLRKGNMDEPGDHAIEYLKGFLAYPEILRENGYRCGISGKWHLGDSLRPQMGFEHWYVHQTGGGPYYDPPMVRDGRPIKEKGYITDLITEDASTYIRRHAKDPEPFYLSVCYTAPHTPWIDNHPDEYVQLFADCPFLSCPQEPRHPWQISFPLFEGDRLANLRGYFAAVSAMDAGVGRLMQTLRQEGIAENTLVVLTSDNGFNCGHHGIWGKGNGTYPFNLFDTSVKVPFLAMLPGVIPPGRTADALVGGYDWYPTLLDLLGIPQEETALPGRSFAAQLTGEPTREKDECIYVYDEYGASRMIRTTSWKYVDRYPDGPNELYDLANDPGERINCLAAYPHVAKEMQERMRRWFERYTRPSADGRMADVRGFGQDLACGARGFDADAFAKE